MTAAAAGATLTLPGFPVRARGFALPHGAARAQESTTSQVFFPVVGGEGQGSYGSAGGGAGPGPGGGVVEGAPGEFVNCRHCNTQQQVPAGTVEFRCASCGRYNNRRPDVPMNKCCIFICSLQ